MEVSMMSKCLAEFLGTFLLIFTVGSNVLTEVPIFGGVSIAFVLMVCIYSLGGISGANFNPAVSFTLALSKLLGGPGIGLVDFAAYVASQLVGGMAASFGCKALYGKSITPGPSEGFGLIEAGVCELIYTCMLCFVVLNVALAKQNQPNQYYGLAIGFVIIAGAYGAGAVSGGCFNPAVALSLDASSTLFTGMAGLYYTGFELVGATLAALLFRVLSSEDFQPATQLLVAAASKTLPQKLLSEFLGTFMLVLTVGLNVLGGSKAAAFSIAAALTSMIYALGSVSGAHFNPAVSTAILVSGCLESFTLPLYLSYMVAQVGGGISAAFVYQAIQGDSINLGPAGDSTLTQALSAELAYTFVLAFVVLSVAVSTATKSKDMFGLAIGGCVTVGGFAIGSLSGGSLNPAVSFGLATGHAVASGSGSVILSAVYYSLVELAAGIVAALIFRATHVVELWGAATTQQEEPMSRCLAEFVGTFLLVFTVGCNVLTNTSQFVGVSIAFVLMVSIYSLGGISGANFNPAVSLALVLSKGLNGPGIDVLEFGRYVGSQISGALAANLCYKAMLQDHIELQPAGEHSLAEAGVCELIYTFMLCFVVLNVACAKENQPNQYYGLAIGFVIIAGAYGAGAVSGGCFNPAVVLGLDSTLVTAKTYIFCEMLGAVLAVAVFMLVRLSEDFDKTTAAEMVQSIVMSRPVPKLAQKLVSEFLGTFMLVLTVGLNVLGGSKAAAFSIAAALTSMIYALGGVSGAHFNPAVSTAILVSGRGGLTVPEYLSFMITQVGGAICAAFVYQGIQGDSISLGPAGDYTLTQALCAELVYTFVLAFVVLSVAVSSKTKSTEMFGLAIGGCVTVGGFAIGSVSGGSLNPAVSFGLATGHAVASGSGAVMLSAVYYTLAELAAGAVAALVYRTTHAIDFTDYQGLQESLKQ